MEIAVVGSGYVGLVAGGCFAETGNDVICVDIDADKVRRLTEGHIPIFEPGLEELVKRNVKAGRLSFTTSLEEGVKKSKVIFIAVGTPQDEDGSADLTHVLSVAKDIGRFMDGPRIVVDKSTVPVGTADLVEATIRKHTSFEVDVVSNPEFLKESAALDDFLKPDRVVVGVASERAALVMKELYAPFVRTNKPILIMDVRSAEMTKYAANTMLALRVSFMNEIANLCERAGADINQVRVGIGTDSRIGMSFIFPGCGYGGSCFPKDVQALINTGKTFGMELQIPIATERVNKEQKLSLVRKITGTFGEDLSSRSFGVWGLAFKPNTDDTREAPSLTIVGELIKRGARVAAYDPEGNESFLARFGAHPALTLKSNSYDVLGKADALVICTEWNAFRSPHFERMKGIMKTPIIFDGRNLYQPEDMKRYGFTYYSIGRPVVT